ncbi:MAG: glycosyltransferase [Candidatus Amulumruptor caecigallinarius]|nr:glycosyltransferase [Candidatus Amulumruptor caecigallinarius]MCM1396311.1 glycosyltransferase [Candidatus Amulumruptor caecigallinarius]MCM1453747.1 glycosyltransferase [bacterium]
MAPSSSTRLGIRPTVSVIIPNYNHARFLKQRIDSVLEQSFADLQVIILDDCSTDNSREVIESYRHHPRVEHIVYNETNSGSTFAQWQRGLALATGKYVWIAESDDYAAPEFLATLVPLLDANPSAVMAFTGSHMVGPDGQPVTGMDWDRYRKGQPDTELYSGRELIIRKLLWTSDVYNASMVLFRRDTAPDIEPAQLTMRYCGDWLFWVNTALCGDAIEVRRKLNYFRQHDAKVSPGASRAGLYFTEGLPIMARIADALDFSPRQRAMLAGRTWKRLGKFPQLMAAKRDDVMTLLDRLSPNAASHRRKLIALYEADKYLNFTHLQPR